MSFWQGKRVQKGKYETEMGCENIKLSPRCNHKKCDEMERILKKVKFINISSLSRVNFTMKLLMNSLQEVNFLKVLTISFCSHELLGTFILDLCFVWGSFLLSLCLSGWRAVPRSQLTGLRSSGVAPGGHVYAWKEKKEAISHKSCSPLLTKVSSFLNQFGKLVKRS